MAKQTKQSENLVIYDEVLEGVTGKLHLVVEIPKIETNARSYHQALKNARGIPFDLDAINPLDKMYQYVLEKFPEFKGKPEMSKARVRYFYDQLNGGAYRDAMMLSIATHKDNNETLNFEPQAYEEDEGFMEDDDLPGLIGPPKVVPNLADPVERRLKQLYDWLKANPEHLLKLNTAFELAVIKVNELTVAPKTDENGFQPKPTN